MQNTIPPFVLIKYCTMLPVFTLFIVQNDDYVCAADMERRDKLLRVSKLVCHGIFAHIKRDATRTDCCCF